MHHGQGQGTVFRENTPPSDAGVRLKQIEKRQQSPDHPILMNVGETDYLKFFVLQVV